MKTKITFQAYIPKSLGKPLYDYFKNDPRLRNLKNKEEFIKQLKSCDTNGYYWIPEPDNVYRNLYCSTDTVDYNHNENSVHSIRLGFQIEIDINKISKSYPMVPTDILKHDTMCTGAKHNNLQHSGLSHRVEVDIKDNIGYVKKYTPKRSEERPLICRINHSNLCCGPEKERDKRVEITIRAAANYPYNKLAPDIDFEIILTIERKNINGHIKCEGKHNSFPAYELIINDKRIYHYKPKDSEPGLLNLTLYNTQFKCSQYVSL